VREIDTFNFGIDTFNNDKQSQTAERKTGDLMRQRDRYVCITNFELYTDTKLLALHIETSI